MGSSLPFGGEHGWNEQDNVVGVHIRRGDKLKTYVKKRLGNFDWLKYCDTGGDPRCFQNFDDLSLSEYLSHAQRLLNETGGGSSVFVMTDDSEWIEEQKRTLGDIGLKIMVVGGHGQPGDVDDRNGEALQLLVQHTVKKVNTEDWPLEG